MEKQSPRPVGRHRSDSLDVYAGMPSGQGAKIVLISRQDETATSVEGSGYDRRVDVML